MQAREVVEDVHVHGVDEKAPAIIYRYWPALLVNPYNQKHELEGPRGVTFVVRRAAPAPRHF